jgi:hypothetical protein
MALLPEKLALKIALWLLQPVGPTPDVSVPLTDELARSARLTGWCIAKVMH